MPPKDTTQMSLYEIMQLGLDEQEQQKTTVGTSYNYLEQSQQGQDEINADDIDRGVLGAFGRHLFSSATLGATELTDIGRTEDWETKDTGERVGAALGEFAGMFVPFGILGKGMRAGMGLLTGQGTKQVFRQASKAAGAVAREAGGEAAEHATMRAIEKGVLESGTTITGAPKLFSSFHLGAKFADDAIETTGTIVGNRLRKEFQEANIKYSDEMITSISQGLKTGLREGKYINSVEQWIEGAAKIGAMDPGLKKTLARWGAMAVQESLTLGIYNAASTISIAAVRGEELTGNQMWKGLKHSVALGMAFPAVRGLFKGGGNITLKNGWHQLWSQYKSADYGAIAKTPGGADKLRSFIESLSGGRTKNALAGFEYRLADGTATTATLSSEAIAKLSTEDALAILSQMRTYSTGKGMAQFGKDWAKDMAQSGLRMAAGAFMNNTGLFMEDGKYSNAWHRLPVEETMTHLLIGAFFTRQRGAWNHGRKLSPEFKDQMALAHALGLDTAGLEASLKFEGSYADIKVQGAGLHSDPVSKKIYDVTEAAINSSPTLKDNQQNKTRVPLDHANERDLDKIQHIYNAIKYFNGGKANELVDFEFLPPKERSKLIETLNGIEIMKDSNGQSMYFKDISMGEVMDVINIRLKGGASAEYVGWLKSLSEAMKDENGELIWPIVEPGTEGELPQFRKFALDPTKETSKLGLAKVNRLLDFLAENRVIELDKSEAVDASKFYDNNPDAKKILDKIFDNGTDRFIEQAYGPEQNMPSFDMFDEMGPLLYNITKGNTIEALRTLYDIDTGNIKSLNQSQRKLVAGLDAIFRDSEGKLIGNFKQLADNIIKDDLSREAHTDLTTEQRAALTELRLIYDSYILGKGDKGHTGKAIVTMANITEIVGMFKNAGSGLAGEQILDTGYFETFNNYKLARMLDTYISPEKAVIVQTLMGNGELRKNSTGDLEIANQDAKYAEVLEATGSESQAARARIAWGEVLDYIGYANGRITHQPRTTATGTFAGSPTPLDSFKSIETLYRMLPSTAAKHIEKDLIAAHDKLEMLDKDGSVDFTRNPLFSELKNIKTALDSFATGEGTIQDVDLLVKKVSDRFKEDPDRVIIYNGKEIKVRNILSQLQSSITKAKNQSINAEQTFMDAIDTQANTGDLNLREAFNLILKDDVTHNIDFQTILKELIFGVSQKGAGRAAMLKFNSELKRQLMIKLEMDVTNNTKTLDELVVEYNQTRSMHGMRRIIKSIQESMADNARVNMDRDKGVEDMAADFFKSLSFDNKYISLQGLSERYYLQGIIDGNVIDPAIILKVKEANNSLTNGNALLNEAAYMARVRIESLAPKSERAELLRRFNDGDDILLMKALTEMTTRPVVSIHSGQLIFDNLKSVTKGPRDLFFQSAKDNKITKLFELEHTAVEDGKQTSIYNVNLDNVFSEYPQITPEQKAIVQRGDKLDITEFDPVAHIDPKNAAYVFVSKGRPLLISAHDQNLQNIGTWFTNWRTEAIDLLGRKIDVARNEGDRDRVTELEQILTNFTRSTAKLEAQPTTLTNMDSKLTAIYWHEGMPDMVESRYLNQYQGGGDMFKDLQTLDLKIFKRLNLFEGGNLAPIDRGHLEWVTERIMDRATDPNSDLNMIEAQASIDAIKARLKHGNNVVTLADESSVFILKDIMPSHYQERYDAEIASAGETQHAKDLQYAMNHVKKQIEAGKLPSLDASSKNSMTYIDESNARLLAAREGQAFDPTVVNGFKPIVYHRDKATGKLVAMKTWLVFSPEKADMMKRTNTHVLTTESAAKALFGESTSGHTIKKFVPTDRKTWVNELEAELTKNTMGAFVSDYSINLPIEAFAIGSHNMVEKGVTGSMSLMNYQSVEAVKDIMSYQRLGYILQKIGGMSTDLMQNVRSEIAFATFGHRADQGGIQNFSDASTLTEALLNVHMRADNFIIKDGIERIFTSSTLELLRRPKIENGTSSYLIHDELSTELTNPIYSRVIRKSFVSEGILEEGKANADLRIMLKQGGIAKPSHWGDDIITNISEVRLVGEQNGVDIIFGIEKGKLQFVNNHELLKNSKKDWNNNKGERLDADGDWVDAPGRKVSTKEFEAKIKPIMDIIQKAIERRVIKTKAELFDFLKNPERYTIAGAEPKVIRDMIKKSKIAITVNEVAIPRKSTDVIPTRVEHILDPRYGNHSIVNDYDIAVGHQRDFDMDHLYSFDALPFSAIKGYSYAVGIQEDYIKQSTEPFDFSPFGETGEAKTYMGQNKDVPGIREASANMEIKKMAMGKAISMNQPLTWLSNTGFKLTIDGQEISMNYSTLPENLRNVSGMISRIGNFTQSGVDAWQNDLLIVKEMGKRINQLILIGETGSNSNAWKDSDYNYNPMFNLNTGRGGTTGKTEFSTAQKAVLTEVLESVITTTKRAQAIFNGVYSDGAKEKITIYDIHKRYEELQTIFGPNRNVFVFTKLLKKYQATNDQESLDALYSLFYGAKAGEINIRDQFSFEKIRKRIKEDKDFAGINNIIQFELPGKDALDLIGRHGAGYILKEINQNKMYQHENTAHYPSGKGKPALADIMNITHGLRDRVALLRAAGVLDLDAFSKPTDDFKNFSVDLAPDLKNIEVRDIAYTELKNELGRIQGKIREVQKFTKKENDAELLTLQDEALTVETTLKMIELRAMRDFGVDHIKTPQKLRPLNPNKDGFHTRWENKGFNAVSIYEVPFKINVSDAETVANLIYGNSTKSNGIRYEVDIKPGHGFKGKKNTKYVVLENPIIAHYASDKDVADAYAWNRLTSAVDHRVIASDYAYDIFHAELTKVIDNITNNHRARTKRIKGQKTRINSGRIYGEEGLTEDLNSISVLMRTWGGIKGEYTAIDQLDPDKVRAIALKIIDPQPIARHYVRAGKDALPNLAIKKKAVKTLFKWLHDNNYLDVMEESIRLQGEIYSNIRGNLNPVDVLKATRSLDIFEDNYHERFAAEFEEAGTFMETAMMDPMSITGSFAAGLLKQKNIIKLSSGAEVTLLNENGVLSNGRANHVKFINPGDMPKRYNNCR